MAAKTEGKHDVEQEYRDELVVERDSYTLRATFEVESNRRGTADGLKAIGRAKQVLQEAFRR